MPDWLIVVLGLFGIVAFFYVCATDNKDLSGDTPIKHKELKFAYGGILGFFIGAIFSFIIFGR